MALENDKRSFVTSTDNDIISNLSKDLIDLILEPLPVKDAVRTSVLSKQWRYRWTTMTALNFDRQLSKKLSRKGRFHPYGFIRIINKVMINHMGPILKFLLHIPQKMKLDSFQEVDLWMLILSRNGVNTLNFTNSNRVYPLPSCVFSCVELRKMVIHNCIFKPPIGFEGFPNLQHLSMKKINFGGNLGATVINLPQLKRLVLKSCRNVNNFNIKAVNLQTLWLINCPDAMALPLLHSERLDVVSIRLLESKKDFLQVERFNLAVMLSNLPNILSFTIDGYFLKCLAAEKFPMWLPNEVKCLKQLEFRSYNLGDLDQLEGALYLLQNSPNLKVLRVTHVQGHDADLDLTSHYLESPDCLQTLCMLQTVEMTSLEGSRPELLFVKLLLDHSPHLENMIIRPTATADAQKMLKIAKEVMMFPRASTKAKMVYLNPVP